MTEAQRHKAIQRLIKRYTAANTASKAVARKTLIKEGIYTKKGDLRPEYGGKPNGRKRAANGR
jgi:hypothetical protein